ncbi:MAG: hypothetical protein JRH20_27980 [Deltaproteobacteria bacterium]|nr:hypothetical protein [Deltaproteobacteria bacterium]
MNARKLIASCGVISVLALVGCKFFHEVVVPYADNIAPLAFTGFYLNGQHQMTTNEGQKVVIETHDPKAAFFAMGAIVDDGGARNLFFSVTCSHTCCSHAGGEHVCTMTMPMVIADTISQAGGPGSTVESGLWYGKFVSPGKGVHCQPGYTLDSSACSVSVDGEDFHGNQASGSNAVVIFRP